MAGTSVLERLTAHGNRPGWMIVPLPIGEPDPARRLEQIAAETAARKHRDRAQVGTGIFRFAAGQRAWYRHFPRHRSVNLAVTNAPGPPVPLHLAGAPLLELFPMMPVMGNLTLVVAALSYPGQLNITAVADHDHCPDLEIFTHGVGTALDGLARSAPVPAPLLGRAFRRPREFAHHRPFGKEGMMRLLNVLGRALLDAGSMTWQITWSLILGFALSAVIQAVVRREAIARHLGDYNTRTLALGRFAVPSTCAAPAPTVRSGD